MKQLIVDTRKYREMLLKDLHRPTYHFAPPDDNAYPGDTNGAFFADGVYHMMYLYKNSNTNAFCWGHVSSIDLIHWRHHSDALTDFEGDEGCFSGGAFVDDDKTAYLSFWKFPSKKEGGDKGGVALAFSKPPYEKWERIEPIAVESGDIWGITDAHIDGKIEHIGSADPSNIWKKDGYYYFQAGNLFVLREYGISENGDEHYQSDWTDLFRSKDLKSWEHRGRFYAKNSNLNSSPAFDEDDMCPSLLPLFNKAENGEFTGKYLQLFISHKRGCQYYIGEFEGEKFVPEKHGRMTWNDGCFFAPEALVDDKNRHIMMTWLLGIKENDFEKNGWSGLYSLPRVLWLENDRLMMAPIKEIDSLQFNKQTFEEIEDKIEVKNGESFRLKAECEYIESGKIGFAVRSTEDGSEKTEIYYDADAKKLVMDTTKSGNDGMRVKEEAPFELERGEALSLDIMVDKSIVEVYANKRQAICRSIFPEKADSKNVYVIGDKAKIARLEAYEMFPANMY